MSAYPWSAQAACDGLTSLFFATDDETPAERRDREHDAKSVCAICPAIEPCLQTALANGEKGIWGGTTERERTQMLRAAERQRPPERLAIPVPPPIVITEPADWTVIETRPDLSGVEIRILLADAGHSWHGFQFAVHRGEQLVFLADDEAEAWIYFNSLVMA